jgi:hypothetical protein
MKKKHKQAPISLDRWKEFPFEQLCKDVAKRMAALATLVDQTNPESFSQEEIRILEDALTYTMSFPARFCQYVGFHTIEGEDFLSFDYKPGPPRIIRKKDQEKPGAEPNPTLN